MAANNLITTQDYFSRLELAYNLAPDTFQEDDVDYIEKQFKAADLPFNRDLEAGGRNVLKGLKPDRFEDIIAVVALYRPGPMENIPKYIEIEPE